MIRVADDAGVRPARDERASILGKSLLQQLYAALGPTGVDVELRVGDEQHVTPSQARVNRA
jgi:hypothetical protein